MDLSLEHYFEKNIPSITMGGDDGNLVGIAERFCLGMHFLSRITTIVYTNMKVEINVRHILFYVLLRVSPSKF